MRYLQLWQMIRKRPQDTKDDPMCPGDVYNETMCL